MSPKAKKTTPAKEMKAAKSEKTSAKKGAKAPELSELELLVAAQASEASEDEIEEEESARSSSNAGGNAAALAAATGTGEMSASFKNFRHHPDMENFYRFIFENDLRLEALGIIDEMLVQRANRKMTKTAKLSAH